MKVTRIELCQPDTLRLVSVLVVFDISVHEELVDVVRLPLLEGVSG